MNVLMVTSSYPKFPGDVTAPFVESIARSVAERGHAVDVVLPHHPDLRRDGVEPVRFFPYRYAPLERWSLWGYAQSLVADVHVKPLMVEGGEAQLKAILTHPTSTQELQTRLQELAKEASWKAWEMLSLRPVDADPALAASPADRMTIRQAEILKIAHALGYYRTPRGCTLDEVARTLGISANAIHKNLTAAEQKIVTAYLSGSLWQA